MKFRNLLQIVVLLIVIAHNSSALASDSYNVPAGREPRGHNYAPTTISMDAETDIRVSFVERDGAIMPQITQDVPLRIEIPSELTAEEAISVLYQIQKDGRGETQETLRLFSNWVTLHDHFRVYKTLWIYERGQIRKVCEYSEFFDEISIFNAMRVIAIVPMLAFCYYAFGIAFSGTISVAVALICAYLPRAGYLSIGNEAFVFSIIAIIVLIASAYTKRKRDRKKNNAPRSLINL